jgi:hypothetical protein
MRSPDPRCCPGSTETEKACNFGPPQLRRFTPGIDMRQQSTRDAGPDGGAAEKPSGWHDPAGNNGLEYGRTFKIQLS